MSKKKNTLKDLDEFLKQQAASLVTPEPVSVPPVVPAPATSKAAPPAAEEKETAASKPVTTDAVYDTLIHLARQDPESFRQKLYALIIQITEAQADLLPEDKMLINTALYLKSGDQWKEAIREYWLKKS